MYTYAIAYLYVKQILVDIVIYVPVVNSFIQESRLTA